MEIRLVEEQETDSKSSVVLNIHITEMIATHTKGSV